MACKHPAPARLSAIGLAVILCGAQAWGAAPDIARKYCSNCHKTMAGQTPRNAGAQAPSFLRIANDSVMGDRNHLARVISQSHASMPPFAMTATERRELITYIRAFKTQPD